jgi:hypothetical protein
MTGHLRHAFLAFAYVLLGTRLFWLINRFAINLFTWDQWGFNDATLFEEHSLWRIFRWQYGPHRLGLAGVLAKLLEPFGHWNTRYEAFGIGVLLFLSAVLALWLKKRTIGNLGWEDAIIPLIFLTPSQYEILIAGEPPASFAVPLLLLIIYGLCWTIKSSKLKYLGVLFTNCLLIYTGYGIFIGPITIVLILLEWFKDRNAHLTYAASVAIAVGSFLSFFLGYRRLPAMGCTIGAKGQLLNHFWFMAVMFANFLGMKASQTAMLPVLIGAVMVVVSLIAFLFFCRRILVAANDQAGVRVLPLAFLGYSLLFSLTAAAGRACLGLGIAHSSRYITPLIIGFFGLSLGALSMQKRLWKWTHIMVLFVIAMFGSARVHPQDYLAMTEYSTAKQAWRHCYLTTHDLRGCTNSTGFYVIPRLNPSFMDETHLQQKLDFLERNHLNLYSEPPRSPALGPHHVQIRSHNASPGAAVPLWSSSRKEALLPHESNSSR